MAMMMKNNVGWIAVIAFALLGTLAQAALQKNATSIGVDAYIDQLINSRRQGRNFEQNYQEEIYADGNVDDALQQGNDLEARNLIRDKLCMLGLMSCAIEPTTQHRRPPPPPQLRPYITNMQFGGPRPPLPSQQHYARPQQFGPPRKVGYMDAFAFRPHHQQQLQQQQYLQQRPINYNPRPQSFPSQAPQPQPQPPFAFERPALNFVSSSSPSHQNAAASNIVNSNSNNNAQQHVHHHFHHVEGGVDSQLNSQPAATTAGLQHYGGIQQASLTAGINGYRPHASLSIGYNPLTQVQQPNPHSQQLSTSFHSQNPNYYKKELQNVGGIVASASTHYNPSRQQFVDCYCVPFNHCPAADRIGRKEDLILPIDPRNLGKDIEAAAAATTTATANAAANSTNANRNNLQKREAVDAADQGNESDLTFDPEGRAYYGQRPIQQQIQQQKVCQAHEVCCRRPLLQQPPLQQQQQLGRCGTRNAAGITGRIKNPVYVDGDSEFGEYPWHVAILKKEAKESVYACGGTLIDQLHVITAAHCIKAHSGFDLRARLGEWDVNHDVEFFPYIEREIIAVHLHPQYYAGTLDNDLAVLKLDHAVDFHKNPHISPACLPEKFADFTGARCWTTGWGKDAFGENGKYQNILKEVDVPILSHQLCESQLRQTRLGYNYKLNPGFLCAGGEEGKDACKGDGGGPLVCERNNAWHVVGVVSWGIGCGQVNVPGVYVRVSHYLDWIRQITQNYA